MVMRVVLASTLATVLLGGCQLASAPNAATRPARLVAAPSWSWRIRGWERALHASAGDAPVVSYPTPGTEVLRRRLARASAAYGFRVVSVRFVRAPQGAPVVIVQATSSEARLARDVPAIMRIIDPHHAATEDWLGWAYEGIFFGAQSRGGSPFLDVTNVLRSHGGGQWAIRGSLYPYAHG